MRIALTGSTGLIGRELARRLATDGHVVVPVVRRAPVAGEIRWDPDTASMDPGVLHDIDAVVHLAGEPIAAGRWTKARKTRILESRQRGTAALATAVADAHRSGAGPGVLVSASASGYYGDRGDQLLEESDAPGQGFLSRVCQAWEAATAPASEAGVRVAIARTGIVLSRHGGALARQLPIFRLGVGGPLAGGNMWMPWISRHDHARALVHLITAELEGPVNICGPEPVRNKEYTRALARLVHRPAVMPVPGTALRLVLGEMAGEVLASARMSAGLLAASGFTFDHPGLGPALVAARAEPEA